MKLANKSDTHWPTWFLIYYFSSRRLCPIGEASGPEEEDDETQQPEDFSADHALVLHSDDLSLDEQFAVSQEHSSSSSSTNTATAATATATGSAHIDVTVTPDVGAVNSKTSGPEEEQPTDMMVSNHQVNHPQQQTQSRGPSWKLAANQGAAVAAAVKPANPAYYNVNNGYPTTRPANNGSNSSSSTATGNMSNANPGGAANGGGFRRGGNNAARYNNGSYNNGYGNAGYGRANSWNSSAASSYNGDHHHHHHHHHHQQSTGLSKMHGIEKKIFNDGELFLFSFFDCFVSFLIVNSLASRPRERNLSTVVAIECDRWFPNSVWRQRIRAILTMTSGRPK